MPELLDTQTIDDHVNQLTGWEKEGNAITRTLKFGGFPEAVQFVNKLVEPAESMNHHPDIEISYNTVNLSLTTHSEGGLTDNDFQLAEQINKLA
ncbi:MAG TPA: 4a-hydroxytetrahydrobiopterin dehydratase [bacterium]|nr:4a-hydroxytetrahydrobiopterin dehydratase [bacterium]